MFYFLIVLSVYVGLSESAIPRTSPCELRDAYGYDNIYNDVDYFDWVLAIGPSSHDMSTGPSSNSANETDGCYLLHKTSSTSQTEFTLLVSPCYTALDPTNNKPSLRFFHYTYGQDVGSIGAYLRPDCLYPADWTTATVRQLPGESDFIWETVGSQNNSWTEVKLPLDILNTSTPFQIVFEVFEGNGPLSDIALDEINVSGIECYSEDDAKFMCDNSNCIPGYLVCDDIPDCIDGTDEPTPGCCNPYTEFMCDNGRCTDVEKRCDGIDDCTGMTGGADEENCPGSSKNRSMPITPTTMATVTEMSMTDFTMSLTTATLLTDVGETTYNVTSVTTRQTSIQTSMTTINYDDDTDTTGKSGVVLDTSQNYTTTFCEKNLIISGIDNCSFIGITVALGLIIIVFAIWIITRIINRCLDNPQRRKSRAVSETKNSLVNDSPEWESNTGQDNKATIGETITQATNENGVAVVVDKMHSTKMTTKVASKGEESDRVSVIDETTREEGLENLEMKIMNVIIDDKDRRKADIIEEFDKSDNISSLSNNEGMAAKVMEHSDENKSGKSSSVPVYAVVDHSRASEVVEDSTLDRSARETSYEDVEKNDKSRNSDLIKASSAPVYAEPDKSRKSNVIQDPQLGRNAIDNSYEDVNMNQSEKTSTPPENSTPESRKSNLIPDHKLDNNLITPYAETEINAGNAHKPATSSEGNDDIPLYSMPDKRKTSQASTNSIGLDGYSKVQSKPVDDSDMYEEVKVGNMDKVTELRRPTLPEGHPLLPQKSKGKSQTDSQSTVVNSLSIIDENHNADTGLYAEANFDSKGDSGVVETDKDEKQNGENDHGDQTEWVDNIVYARTSVGT